MSGDAAIGVDIGGTKIALGIVDANGIVLGKNHFPTPVDKGVVFICDKIIESIKEMRNSYPGTIDHVGVSVAGQIAPRTGEIIFAPNLGWSHVPFKKILSDSLKVALSVLNDVRAATWGEWKYGAGIGCDDLICIFIGTGVGGGIISGGRLIEGDHNCAGELGHSVVMMEGPQCTCGGRGCLEAFAGGWAIAKQAQEAVKLYPNEGAAILRAAKGELQKISAHDVLDAASKLDPLSCQLIENAVRALIAGSSSLVNTLNPNKIIIGGGLGMALPGLAVKLKAGIQAQVLKAAYEKLDVVESKLGNNAAIIGSARFSFDQNKF